MFAVVAAAISAGKALYSAFTDKPIPPSVDAVIRSSMELYTAVRSGYVRVTDDDGAEMTPAQFDAKFAAWEAAQRNAGENAAARIEQRHED